MCGILILTHTVPVGHCRGIELLYGDLTADVFFFHLLEEGANCCSCSGFMMRPVGIFDVHMSFPRSYTLPPSRQT